MAMARLVTRGKQWLKTMRNPPVYVTASLIVALGGLLNGFVSVTLLFPRTATSL